MVSSSSATGDQHNHHFYASNLANSSTYINSRPLTRSLTNSASSPPQHFQASGAQSSTTDSSENFTPVASSSNQQQPVDSVESCENKSQALNGGQSTDGTVDMYTSPFSPDDSSYSENSDYTSDEYDIEVTASQVSASKAALEEAQQRSAEANSHLINSLPSFPTIGLTNNNIISTSFVIPGYSHMQSQFTTHALPYALQAPQHYSYPEAYNNQYILQASSSTAATTSAPVAHQSHLHHQTLSQQHIHNITSTNGFTTSRALQPVYEEHNYIDLSQSISSKGAENMTGQLLSAANGANELTLVINPMEVILQSHVTSCEPNELSCPEPIPDENGLNYELDVVTQNNGIEPLNASAENSSSDQSIPLANQEEVSDQSQTLDELDENFGEIIMKSMVETVTA